MPPTEANKWTLAHVRDIFAIVGVVIAVFTLTKAVIEYRSVQAQSRFEYFVKMRERFKANVQFQKILALEHRTDPESKKLLSEFSLTDKRDILGFFEEVALMLNSGLINEEVAHYMFGVYAIDIWKNDAFWEGEIKRDNPYFGLFKDFVVRMENLPHYPEVSHPESKFRF